jgi:hypothetical protein
MAELTALKDLEALLVGPVHATSHHRHRDMSRGEEEGISEINVGHWMGLRD